MPLVRYGYVYLLSKLVCNWACLQHGKSWHNSKALSKVGRYCSLLTYMSFETLNSVPANQYSIAYRKCDLNCFGTIDDKRNTRRDRFRRSSDTKHRTLEQFGAIIHLATGHAYRQHYPVSTMLHNLMNNTARQACFTMLLNGIVKSTRHHQRACRISGHLTV